MASKSFALLTTVYTAGFALRRDFACGGPKLLYRCVCSPPPSLFTCVLQVLHTMLSGKKPTDKPEKPHDEWRCECLVHRVFGMRFQHCTAAKKVVTDSLFSLLVNTPLLVEARRRCPHLTFAELTQLVTQEESEARRKALARAPEVFTVGFVWESVRAPENVIGGVLDAIDPFIDISKFGLRPRNGEYPRVGQLHGMFCYYGRHYVAFFHDASLNCWVSHSNKCRWDWCSRQIASCAPVE